MNKSCHAFHNNVFYDDSRVMDFAVCPGPSAIPSLPCAVIVPHAEVSHILHLLEESFGYVSGLSPELVAVLSPLHNPLLEEDRDLAAITCSFDRMDSAAFRIDVCPFNHPGVGKNDAYFYEEPSIELLFPIISRLWPGVPVLPLFAGSYSPELKEIVAAILKEHPGTLFVLSTNGGTGDWKALAEILCSGTSLQEAYEKQAVNPCGYMWLEAIGGKWHLGSVQEDEVLHFCGARSMTDV